MMQQVATRQSESAASKLPLDIASSTDAKSAFNQVMSDESQKVSAFEFAKTSADNAAAKQHSNRENEKYNADMSVEHATSSEKSHKDTTSHKALNSQAERANKSHDAQETTKHLNENELKLDESTQSIATELSEDSDALSLKAPAEQETFDYISYVTQLAEFTGNESDTKLTQSQIFSAELDALASKSDESAAEALNLLVQIDAESGQEFTKVSLSKQDLQAILDAQDAQLDLNANLSIEELAKLQDIISSMLAQLQPSTDDASTAQSSEHTKADQALLTSLLMSQDKNHNFAADKLDKANNKPVLHAMNASQLSVPVSNPTSEHSEKDAQSLLLSAELNHESKETDGNIWRKTPDLLAKTPTNDMPWAKTPDTTVKQADTTNTNKPSLINLAELSEEQANKAINSIAERVQSLASDVNSNVKGSEFVAALQSGLKEFKQQLSSGREPGIDLKSIINDVIASTNPDAETKLQPKIDAAINQVNAVLNLANAVNQTASQLQGQLSSPTDLQFAKEMQVMQTEGTKIANSATGQLNSQASVNKAFNIEMQSGQQQLAEKVRWMVNSRNPSAEIRLDPPDLGGMQIKVNLSGDTAQVSFTVQSIVAKDVLDQAAPRLRDMLAQQGIELGQSSVQQDSGQQQGQQSDDGNFAQTGSGTALGQNVAETDEELTTPIVEQRVNGGALGGIDYYA
ncbi:flagellar hook-length control protein FliK [Glaciecola sp. 2405UD65-10]|uniref:flagellar hook-length control protein FliK n=1 Tax=Glaciecola sp. 2405UD65-10 TaxID=3397244 RepID=UPI003B59FD88